MPDAEKQNGNGVTDSDLDIDASKFDPVVLDPAANGVPGVLLDTPFIRANDGGPLRQPTTDPALVERAKTILSAAERTKQRQALAKRHAGSIAAMWTENQQWAATVYEQALERAVNMGTRHLKNEREVTRRGLVLHGELSEYRKDVAETLRREHQITYGPSMMIRLIRLAKRADLPGYKVKLLAQATHSGSTDILRVDQALARAERAKATQDDLEEGEDDEGAELPSSMQPGGILTDPTEPPVPPYPADEIEPEDTEEQEVIRLRRRVTELEAENQRLRVERDSWRESAMDMNGR